LLNNYKDDWRLERENQASRQGKCLGERRLGAVCGASALALAGVLAGVLAAALTFTVVLALAGVLGEVGGRLRRTPA
jgi:fructose-1,6-bisphosphatase/inositol monophosphatase family enzyme